VAKSVTSSILWLFFFLLNVDLIRSIQRSPYDRFLYNLYFLFFFIIIIIIILLFFFKTLLPKTKNKNYNETSALCTVYMLIIYIYIYNSLFCVTLIMRWLLKSQYDQNSIMINHKSNSDFKSHLIIGRTQEWLLA